MVKSAVLVATREVGFVERRVLLKDRLAARLLSARLDRRLRRGEAPESSVVLAVRAAMLVHPRTLAALATSLERMMALAARPSSSLVGSWICRHHVREVEPELVAIRRRITSDGPVAARGVAELRALLTDGSGPFYQHRDTSDLGARLRMALVALDS